MIGVLLCVLMAGLWWTLKKQEKVNRHKAVAAEAEKLLSIIDVDINNRMKCFQRFVNRWEIRSGTSKEEFITNAQAYIADDPGYQAIEWVDKRFHVRWIIPLAGNEADQDLNLAFDENSRIALERARDQKLPTMSSPIDLVQGGKGFLVYFPIYVHGEFEGFILAVFRTQEWLEHLLHTEESQNELENFLVLVSVDGSRIFKEKTWDHLEESRLDVTAETEILGHRFQIRIRPTKIFIDQSRTWLPEMVFAVGVLLSVLISIIVYLFRKASEAVHLTMAGKASLENEIIERKQVEAEREKLLHEIAERVKELNCLFDLSRLAENTDTRLESIFQGTIELIHSAWKHSEFTCVRIIFEDREFKSAHFKETEWKQEAPILKNGEMKGSVQVFYTREFPDSFEGPFLKEERHLINEIADRLGIIIQRKMAAEMLATERRRLSDILIGTNVGTWEWNVLTGNTIFNERWAEIIGYTLEEIAPVSIDTWMKFTHPDDLKVSGDLLEKHFNGELDYYECEARMRHKNGSWVWVLDRGKVSTWTDDGKPILMSGTHQDITDRKRAEENLHRLEGAFFHDILNTASVIKGFAQILVDENSLSKEEDAYLRKRMSRLSDRLIDEIQAQRNLVSAENGDLTIEFTKINSVQLLNEVSEFYRHLAVAKDKSIVLAPDVINIDFCSDPTLLIRILGNLTKNALEASKPHQKITIGCRTTSEDHIRFYVHNPTVISQQVQYQIFEHSFSTKSGGRGIGTYSVKLLTEQYLKGTVSFTSEEGKGTYFFIELPRNIAST